MTYDDRVRIIDPDAERHKIERQQRNQRMVFLGLTILTAMFILADILSDMVLRNNANHFHGISATSWDFNVSVFSIVWTAAAIRLWRNKD